MWRVRIWYMCVRVSEERLNFIIFDEILKLVDEHLSFSFFVVSFAIPYLNRFTSIRAFSLYVNRHGVGIIAEQS